MLSEHQPIYSSELRSALGSWYPLLSDSVQEHTLGVLRHVEQLRERGTVIYPPKEQVFQALQITQPEQVKCVILGQDPYHGAGQANGLAFSVSPACKLPPSLRNIYKELSSDIGSVTPANGDLSAWAKQGVLLLNSVLTVEEKKAGSHAKLGWQTVTQEIIRILFQLPQPIVFLLWGKYASNVVYSIKDTLPNENKKFIESAHPSPLSAHQGFFGSRPFSQTNQYLQEHGVAPIQWNIG